MTPTKILVNEHLVIEQVLNCLERLMERCQRQRKLEAGPAQDAVVFLRAFAERCHHSKFETHVLPVMQAAGVSPERCLECPMRHRKGKSRDHLDAMEAAIEPAAAGDATAVKQFTEHARAYIGLLLEYIESAEDCLFPMINKTLSEVDRRQLMEKLRISDAEPADDRQCKTYIDIANRLADQLNVPHAVIPGSGSDPG